MSSVATSPPADATPRRRSDGEQTQAAILDVAVRLASIEGRSSLTIGRLARELGVRKSGVFAHFRSKQRLQQETIDAAGEVCEREVLAPAGTVPPGVARLRVPRRSGQPSGARGRRVACHRSRSCWPRKYPLSITKG